VFVAQNVVSIEKDFLKRETSGRTVQLERVEKRVAKEAPPPHSSERLRNAQETLFLDNDEPTTYAKVMIDPNSHKWKCHGINQICNLVDLLDGVKTIVCKWIYKKKDCYGRKCSCP
jgi:hypothetical protein